MRLFNVYICYQAYTKVFLCKVCEFSIQLVCEWWLWSSEKDYIQALDVW